jgi:hypothetical protein
MPKQPKIYRRLPGTGTTLASYVRLYQGADHLLQVTSTGFSERYKRFYYHYIQAITVRKNIRGKLYNGILTGFVLLFALPAFDMGGTGAVVMLSKVIDTCPPTRSIIAGPAPFAYSPYSAESSTS